MPNAIRLHTRPIISFVLHPYTYQDAIIQHYHTYLALFLLHSCYWIRGLEDSWFSNGRDLRECEPWNLAVMLPCNSGINDASTWVNWRGLHENWRDVRLAGETELWPWLRLPVNHDWFHGFARPWCVCRWRMHQRRRQLRRSWCCWTTGMKEWQGYCRSWKHCRWNQRRRKKQRRWTINSVWLYDEGVAWWTVMTEVSSGMAETDGGRSMRGGNRWRRGMHEHWQGMRGVERRRWALAGTMVVACGAVGGNDSRWRYVVQKETWGMGEEEWGGRRKRRSCNVHEEDNPNDAVLVFFFYNATYYYSHTRLPLITPPASMKLHSCPQSLQKFRICP